MSSKLLTLATARTELGRYIENGTCDTETIDARINEAVQRLILKPEMYESPRLLHTVRISVCNREFALPRGVEKIVGVNINGLPSHVFNRMYQFLSSGPGDLDIRSWASLFSDLMDLGEAPYQFGIPFNEGSGHKLVAFSTSVNDVNQILKIRGFGATNKEVTINLPINVYENEQDGVILGNWDAQQVSNEALREFFFLSKPVTTGYITLYAVDTATNEMWVVGQYHPSETLPMFRRYRITNKNFEDATEERTKTNILALVMCGYTKLTQDDDLVPLDSLPALKNMIIAIDAENVGDLNKASAYEMNAVRLLSEVKAASQITNSTISIIDHDRYLMGSMINRRLI